MVMLKKLRTVLITALLSVERSDNRMTADRVAVLSLLSERSDVQIPADRIPSGQQCSLPIGRSDNRITSPKQIPKPNIHYNSDRVFFQPRQSFLFRRFLENGRKRILFGLRMRAERVRGLCSRKRPVVSGLR